MEHLAEELMEELNVETGFTIPFFGGIEVYESTVVSWIIMAVIILFMFIMTRGLRTQNISKRQAAVELIYTKLMGLCDSMMGEEGRGYVPYLVTVLLFIGVSNIVGIFGLKAPTKDLNITLALAGMTIILVQFAGIKHKGFGGWLKSFTEPVAVVTPIKIMELVTKPLSLCMRLFGNVLGAFVIMELLKLVVAPVLPAVFCLYFDLFDGLLQAYVFVFLTSLYIKEAIE